MKRAKRRNWTKEMEKLNSSRNGQIRYVMSTPTVAQVTRCRLLRDFDNIEAETRGCVLEVRLAA